MGIEPIPRPVKWAESDGTIFNGTVVEETVSIKKTPHGDFYKVMQVIQKEGDEGELIRCGYYRKAHNAPDSEYRWASRKAFIVGKKDFDKMRGQLSP